MVSRLYRDTITGPEQKNHQITSDSVIWLVIFERYENIHRIDVVFRLIKYTNSHSLSFSFFPLLQLELSDKQHHIEINSYILNASSNCIKLLRKQESERSNK